ncbi:histidine phosphatase family protein [Frigoriglobus tundricola]|uniref:Phosphoglycerate mutase family n=1 Tax=Frigoriglobus tundricola TaxID=2774151 RepID=A0A6M5Z4J2_9BACT|nr:histidine phosphatase family protein [Frigoriglobus tundricola]QJX00707.1 Phosphoglycerate mutase family [Frigoriglobus tundricola]
MTPTDSTPTGPEHTSAKVAQTVWLVRHAETAAPTLFHGAESDVELGAHGRRQTAAVVPWFAALRPSAVVSSAMRRAVETAAPIAAACGVPHLREPDLHERRVGSLSRQPREQADSVWEETLARWIAGDTGFAIAGMESFDAIRDRTLPAFRRVAEAHPGGRVVIVCHGVVCKVLLLSLLRGRTAADWVTIGRAQNLAVSELVPDAGTWTARQLLTVPPPVAEVNAAFAEAGVRKTEA